MRGECRFTGNLTVSRPPPAEKLKEAARQRGLTRNHTAPNAIPALQLLSYFVPGEAAYFVLSFFISATWSA
jgi:hypothetical protein